MAQGDKRVTLDGLKAVHDYDAERVDGLVSAVNELQTGLLNAYPTDSVSGSIANFPDGAGDVPIKALNVEIEPVQAGSGDPSPDNIRPISGWTGVNVTRTGVNVWDEEWEVGNINSTTGATTSSEYTIRSKDFCLCAGGQSYFIVKPENYQCYAYWYDASKTYISRSGGVTTQAVTAPDNGYYFKLVSGNSQNPMQTYANNISLNYPSTDHDYHAYTGATYTISWQTEAGTVYGGTLDVVSGVLTVDRAYKAFSELNGWQYRSDQFDVSISNGKPQSEAGKPSAFITDTYETKASGTSGSYPNETCAWQGISTNQALIFRVRDPSITSVSDFLAAHGNANICYELATPLTYNLTPTQIKTLVGTNNIWSDAGDVGVTYRADIALYIQKMTGSAENDMIADSPIASGKYFLVGNTLYLSTAAIAAGAKLTPGTNCVQTTLADALNALNN